MAQSPPHIALLPSPGMGHLIPLAEFAKRLAVQHGFTATIILPTDGPLSKAQRAFLDSLPASIGHVLLPPVSFDDLPDDVRIETRIALTVSRSLRQLRDALRRLSAAERLAALVVDLFGTDAFDVCAEFDISPYIFYPTTATALSLFLHLPELDKTVVGEFRDLPDPVQIPGSVPIPGKLLLDPVQDRKDKAYETVLRQTMRYQLAEGIIINTFEDLEPGPIKYFQKPGSGNPPVYPVGPLIQADKCNKTGEPGEKEDCIKWLDEQPGGSVLYVSYGSGGTLSSAQLAELALGLEMSEQRFLWVVRSPNDAVSNATYFSVHSQNDPLAFLPEGFVERTKGRGFLVPSWAPQAKILAHEATGGFLTHCGWNSTLESVVEGVPLVTWPLFAEQKMNAFMLDKELGVALRPKVAEDGVVGRLEVANVVKRLMEGEEGKKVRSRMRELKEAAAKVIGDGGSSAVALAVVANKWKSKVGAA